MHDLGIGSMLVQTESKTEEPPPMPDPLVTFVGMAHPWMCDINGHVNVRHQMGFFDDASFQLLCKIAGDGAGDLGWADARTEVSYRSEISPGTPLTIHSRVTRVGRTSITYRHSLFGSLDKIVRSEAETVTVRFDLATRKAAELEADVRARADALVVQDA